MAKNDKQKDQQQKDKLQNKQDAQSLIELSKEFVAGRFDEDTYIDAAMALTSKLGKNKKPKKVKFEDRLVLEINTELNDFQVSYLRGVINQVFKDTTLRIKLKL